MKRKRRSGCTSGPGAPAVAPGACTTTGDGGAKGLLSLVRLRAIEHGVEENDLASVNGIRELLPLLAALKEGQVGRRRRDRVPNRACAVCVCVWRVVWVVCGLDIR